MTPEAVGDRIEDTTALIDAHLQGIPGARLYDGKMSVYHLADGPFRGTVRLREHFRCIPEIISFSNALSYDFSILPLRDGSTAAVKPAVVPVRVPAATNSRRAVNPEEALQVAALVVAASEQPEYEKLSFGVISLVGQESDQPEAIRRILTQVLPSDIHERHRIICGTSAQFQGDERNVIFLSMVDVPRESGGLLPMRNDDLFKKRYNVAVSRAEDQLWVIHSIDRQDVQSRDLRRELLDFAYDPGIYQRHRDALIAKAESPFESAVIDRLVAAGYEVHAQYPAGNYRIDIVVEGNGKRLAIECDGDRFHTEENLREDLDRQALLERLRWQFHRIRGTAWYRDTDGAFAELIRRIEAQGILPNVRGGSSEREPFDAGEDHELRDRVLARARQLLEEWEADPGLLRYGDARRAHPASRSRPPAAATSWSPPEPGPASPPPVTQVAPGKSSDPDPHAHPSRPLAVEPFPDEMARARLEASGPAAATRYDHSARHWEAGVAGTFAPYDEADLDTFRPAGQLMHETDSTLHPMILQVVRVEAPVHFDTVIERLRVRYGMGRVRGPSRTHVASSIERLAALHAVRCERTDTDEDLFLFAADASLPLAPRGSGVSGTRSVEHIAPEELDAGLLAVIRARGGSHRGELIDETARAFGWRRTGDTITQQLGATIDRLLQDGRIIERAGRLKAALDD